MRPRLYSCYFGHASRQQWETLARVLLYSAHQHCRDWDITVERIDYVRHTSAIGLVDHEDNTRKLERWLEVVTHAPDGQRLLLIDTDAVILGELDRIWNQPFDLAYAGKQGTRYPLNGGVIFLRATKPARAFMRRWAEVNRQFLCDRRYQSHPLRRRYGGINQAALGSVLQGTPIARTLELPCEHWNCEDETWQHFSPNTRILHIKGGLRREALQLSGPRPKFAHMDAVNAWRDLERASRNEAACA